MGLFAPRTFTVIMKDMLATLLANTPLTDVNYGTIWTTMLEAAATEDDEQYFQMLEIIRGYSLDTVEGSDLDARAAEYSLTRVTAAAASTTVTLGDSAFVKVVTNVYAGLPGALAGSMAINGDVATGFPASGSVILGRGTTNVEKVPYASVTQFANYVTFNLSAATAKDHGTSETIILAKAGDRVISSGSIVKVPASDTSPEVQYTLDVSGTILDGETQATGIDVTCNQVGSVGNVPIGAIQAFQSKPFATATVSNPQKVTNGLDDESDQDLRDRIKNTIQSLSRGTGTSIINGVLGLTSSEDNKRVVSVTLRDTTTPGDVVKLFVDDGTGFIPSFLDIGVETVVTLATGGEQYLNVANFPLVKAFVETQNSYPFNIANNATLFVTVNGVTETITFVNSDFASPGAATAQEVLIKINAVAVSFEARVSSGGSKVRIFSRTSNDEEIQVTGGTANSGLAFQTDQKFTAKLYLLRAGVLSLLSKDGRTAAIESGATQTYDLSSGLLHLSLAVDGRYTNLQKVWFDPATFISPTAVTADIIAAAVNAQAAGVNANLSSSSTRLTVSSKTERSAISKVRIVSTFTNVFNTEGGVLVDRTTEAKTSANVQMFGANLAYLYLGHTDVPFDSVYAKLSTAASNDIGAHFEYWNGTAWTAVGVDDGTLGFTQSGNILFQAPFRWRKTTVQSVTAYWFRIQRTTSVVTVPPVESYVMVCGANLAFQFGETEVAGANNDYTMNRFNGQIELETPLIAGDVVTLGSFSTRPYVVSGPGNWSTLPTAVLTLIVDGVTETITFASGDFVIPTSAMPTEVAAAINARVPGVTATTAVNGTAVQIQVNRMNGGTLQIVAGGANTALNFSTSLATGFTSHVPAIESSQGPWSFAPSSNLIIVVDGNFAASFNVPIFKESVLTAATSTTVLVDSSLSATFPTDGQIAGFDLYVENGTQVAQRLQIASYVAASGTVTLTSALPGLPAIGDKYQVIPKSTAELVAFLQNKQVTLLTTQVEVRASDAGRRVQLASLNAGETAAIEVSGGTANTQLVFPLTASGTDGYRYFTGLLQQVQWTVDGLATDQATYPGLRAAGVQVEGLEAVTIPVAIAVTITTQQGVALTSIVSSIKSAISNYINRLRVGDDVILSEVTVQVKGVSGVFDAQITSPTANIAIADNEQARIADSAMSVV